MSPTVSHRTLLEPKSLRDALKMLRDEGALTPMAGCTDLYVSLNFGTLKETRFLNLWRLDALRTIEMRGDLLCIGAMATHTDLMRSPLVRRRIPMLAAASSEVGGVQIQNRGTLGGNIANASPAGDTLPILLAADATILVGGQRGEREIKALDYFISYRKTALAPDELILHVKFPLPPRRELRFRKVGTRRAQAISKVVMALAWQDGPKGWSDVRVALGSVAATPIRAAATEAVLEGARPTPEVADLAAETLAGELEPIDDVRSTADYRRAVSARVLHRLLRDAGGW
jgi:CO/xanthine dehydrogenase FAD-binding subunit